MMKIMNSIDLKKYLIIPFNNYSGEMNMSIDFEMAMKTRETGLPCLRFYGWKEPTISLGKFQNEDVLDWEKVSEMGFKVIRRPTGGRAVLHANELTYCITIPSDTDSSRKTAFKFIAKKLIKGLKYSGFFSEYQSGKQGHGNQSCFSSVSEWEIVNSTKKKLIGSAQVVLKGAILQHGSIPLNNKFLSIDSVLKSRYAQINTERSASWIDIESELLVENMIKGFKESAEFIEIDIKNLPNNPEKNRNIYKIPIGHRD